MASEHKERTLGDGMDNSLMALTDSTTENVPFQLNLRSSTAILKAMKPVEPIGKIITTIPKYVPNARKSQKYLTGKPKEPKFIPYEPFKGAVEPIIPIRKKVLRPIKDKNNIDIHELVSQMSEIRIIEMNKAKLEAIENDELVVTRRQWEEQKAAYETDIKNLRDSNIHLENQLKFQAQVNSELKTLLVAAVGEDLESRVQHLTEDKLQLARMLLNSANRLTSHEEQTEWLSGQCEVWRSKFLASTLMVEELARWKTVLSQRINDLNENLKNLTQERSKVRKYSMKCLNNLIQINDKYCKIEGPNIKSSNIIDLATINCKLSENIVRDLLQNDVDDNSQLLSQLPSNTPAEKVSVQLMRNPIDVTTKPDAICNAVMGAAMSMGGGQLYLQHPLLHATCCSHCKGEVQDI